MAAPFKSEVSKITVPERTRSISSFMPSLTDVIFGALLFTMAFGSLAQRLLDDSSTGWHIRAGQRIVRTASLPHTDPFSSAGAGHTWFAWEWLFDIAAGLADDWRELNGVALLASLVVAATFAFAFRLVLVRGAPLPWAILLLLLSFSASLIHLLARPHIVTWLMAIVWFHVLDRAEWDVEGRAMLLWLPLLMIIWVNVHGGFLLGLGLMGLFLVVALVSYVRADRVERQGRASWLRSLALTTAATAVCSLINPYGYQLHLHAARYLSNSYFMNHIDEFRSPDFHGAAQQCFVVLILLALIAVARRSQALRLSQLIVMLFAVYYGMYSSRNLPVASLLLMLTVGPLLPEISRHRFPRARAFDERMVELELAPRLPVWPIVTVVCAVLLCAKPGVTRQVQFSSARFPEGAVNHIAGQSLNGPIFVPDSWGGYLIYRLYPQAKVVFDDRHDLLGQAAVEQYVGIVDVRPEWQGSLRSLGANWMILPSRGALASAARLSPEWRQVYSDSVATVFQRNAE